VPQGPSGRGHGFEPLGEAFEGGDRLGGLGGFVGGPSLCAGQISLERGDVRLDGCDCLPGPGGLAGELRFERLNLGGAVLELGLERLNVSLKRGK
jgi:hypothetical protein